MVIAQVWIKRIWVERLYVNLKVRECGGMGSLLAKRGATDASARQNFSHLGTALPSCKCPQVKRPTQTIFWWPNVKILKRGGLMGPARKSRQSLVQSVHHWPGDRVMQSKLGCQVCFSGKGNCEQERHIQNTYHIYFGLTVMHIPGLRPSLPGDSYTQSSLRTIKFGSF